MKYQIIHAERDFRFHEKLKKALAPYPEFEFIDHCCYLDSVVPLLNNQQPSILITASKVYDEPNAVEAFCSYRDAIMPELKIVVLTSKESMDHFLNSVVAGADGYLSKASGAEELYTCLCQVMKGDHYLGLQTQAIDHK